VEYEAMVITVLLLLLVDLSGHHDQARGFRGLQLGNSFHFSVALKEEGEVEVKLVALYQEHDVGVSGL